VSLPLALLFVPSPAAPVIRRAHLDRPGLPGPGERRAYLLLAGLLVVSGTIFGLVSVHLLTLLQARGETLAAAVSLGAMVGPSQVAARVLEMAGRGRHHPLWTLRVAVVLIAAGVCLLAFDAFPIVVAIVLYGAGNGVFSIARGTVPLALFGPETYAAVMGRLARPALIAQALAPTAGAAIIAYAGSSQTFIVLAMLAVVAVGLVTLLRERHPEADAALQEEAGPA
jgi:hypothetical protein